MNTEGHRHYVIDIGDTLHITQQSLLLHTINTNNIILHTLARIGWRRHYWLMLNVPLMSYYAITE